MKVRPEVRTLLDYAEERGCTCEYTRSGHWKVRHDQRYVATVASTPSGKRWLANSKAYLKRRLAELAS
jgi:hypothetical protein